MSLGSGLCEASHSHVKVQVDESTHSSAWAREESSLASAGVGCCSEQYFASYVNLVVCEIPPNDDLVQAKVLHIAGSD